MPPAAKITKEMILHTALDITRETGFDMVNARSIAGRLQCSTRPLFTCYENMEALKVDFLAFSYRFYEKYVADYRNSAAISPCLVFPLSYLEFSREEPHLFQLLFVSDMDLKMSEAQDFYRELDNEKHAQAFSESIGLELERAKVIFLDLFLYTHGMAVLTAAKKLSLQRSSAEKMLANFLTAFIRQEKPGWSLPCGDTALPLSGQGGTS